MLCITLQASYGCVLCRFDHSTLKPIPMKTTLLMCVAMLLCSSISAQTVITRISAGQDTYYYNNELQTALNDASPGDTILVPGFQYVTNLTINTSVVMIGVGYLPELSTATGISLINGNLIINAPNTEVSGFKIVGNITFSSGAFDSVLQRCKAEANLTFGGNSHDIIVTECVFAKPSPSQDGLIVISSATNIEINNSLIETLQGSGNLIGCVFNNNVIFDALKSINNATFNCNIIDGGFNAGTVSQVENDNIFNNNVVFAPNCTDTCLTTLIGIDNVSNNNLFVTDESVFGYDLTDYPLDGIDYLVLEASPAFTHCPVNQQVGVYGGPQPFKIGAIPVNPHISSKTISGVSTTDQINVTVGVEAQDN